MKTAKPPASDGATSSSRRQPVRQTRVNPPRTSSLNRSNSLANAPVAEQPIDILPGVTHFTDAITALPKELVRHFTLLKEVDAKIFAPEAALLQLLHSAVNTPARDLAKPLNDASSSIASVSAPISAHNGTTTEPANPQAPSSEGAASSVFDPANIPRRTIFRDTALKIQEMLVSLEEKNHVIATANDALQKQLSRIEDVWPHLEAEFSEEAKWGSATHWAYVENRQAKANDKQAERSRREGAATLSAAAQALAEEAAARSSDRKQAMAAKKSAKNQATEADGDKAQDAGKKAPGGKSRKPLPDSGPVGLGITPGPPGTAPTSKRRKVEAKPNGGTPTERAMGRTTAAMSPSVTSSPVIGSLPDPIRPGRGSPAPSVTAPRPASSRARQNSTQSNVESARHHLPSAASNKPNVNPQGTPDPNQASNGVRTNTDAKTQKEATVPIMNKSNPLKPEAEETQPVPEPAQNSSKKESATKPSDESAPPNKETAPLAIQPASLPMVKTKSGRASKPSTPATATFSEAASSTAGPTTARSRPSRNNNNNSNNAESTTGAAGTNPSSNATAAAAPTTKRSHKKGASISATAAAHVHQQAAAASTTSGPATSAKEKEKDKDKDKDKDSAPAGNSVSVGGSGGGSGSGSSGGTKRDSGKAAAGAASAKGGSGAAAVAAAAPDDDDDDEEEQEVADEDLYCYCNQVSYGEMVACDGDGCPREWFHLECVGLKVAPKVNAKWYCEDCKRRLKIAERR
ncbi:hypothetical protein B0I37DRAFT_429781 [Chaetomium sp. MPI-CAGE-AT-0009]|nr:hypothetical protein B0I37DRAFT_429781 [Chaetomium sp. MPI-CAGE-AT-0009]